MKNIFWVKYSRIYQFFEKPDHDPVHQFHHALMGCSLKKLPQRTSWTSLLANIHKNVHGSTLISKNWNNPKVYQQQILSNSEIPFGKEKDSQQHTNMHESKKIRLKWKKSVPKNMLMQSYWMPVSCKNYSKNKHSGLCFWEEKQWMKLQGHTGKFKGNGNHISKPGAQFPVDYIVVL